MSPAPYPPLHAGDDVDADFFDQLGDELDFPAQEVVPQNHQDAGLLNLSDPPGGLLVSSGAAGRNSPSKVHPEELGFPNLQEGNSQVELEDAFTDLNLETQDLQSVSHGASDAHLLSNGDDLGLHHPPVEAVPDSEDRVISEESSVFDSTASADDKSVAELRVPEESATSTFVPPEIAGVENAEGESRLHSELSFSTDLAFETASIVEEAVAPETGSVENVEPESKLHPDLSFPTGLAAETASIVEDAPGDSIPQDQEEVKPSEVSKVQAQTTKVEEVQWSNFGAQGGFGSFSDFLSVYPADSSGLQDVNAGASNSESDLFHFGEQSTSDVGSSVVAPHFDDVSFFDLHQPHDEGETQTPEVPPQSLGTDYETQAPVQVNTGEIQAPVLEQQVQAVQFDPDQWQNTQSQGQEHLQADQVEHSQWSNLQSQAQEQQTQFAQPDQGIWQELAEYPGWLYNTHTGEWVEKNSSDAGVGTVASWDYASTGEASHYRGGETETIQSQGTEWLYDEVAGKWVEKNKSDTDVGTANSWDYASGQQPSIDRGGENETVQWQGHEVTGNASDENGLQADPHVGQSTAGTSVTEWTGNQENASQTTNTQNPLSVEMTGQQNDSVWQGSTAEAATSVSQSGWEDQYPGWYYDHQAQEWKQYNQPDSTSLPAVSYENTTESNNFFQEPNSTSLPAVSYENTAESNNFSQGYNVEGSAEQNLQYNVADQFAQEFGGSNVVQSSMQNAGQMSSQADIPGQWTGVQPQPFDNTPAYYPSGQPVSNGVNQQYWNASSAPQVDPRQQMLLRPENQYTSYSPAQMHPYQSQPWSSGNPYGAAHSQQYVSQTAPKSVEEALRTSVGRPPHVLTAFAFGGKLVVMKLKDPLSLQSSDGNQSFASGQAFVPGPIQVHSLSQFVAQTSDNGPGETGSSYFGALSRPALSGPLVGGSVSNKELNKWIDGQASNSLSEGRTFSPGSLPMLWGLLKLSSKHYGKLRSQAGSAGITSQEEDGAEAELAKLLTSGGDQSSWTMGSFSSTVCLQPMPSEHQLQVTASEIKKLLVSGKRKEALKIAQQGQLWGPALVLARQLGEKYYADTVAVMAQRQFLPGSPLRTLSLLLAGQPAEVFSENNIQNMPGNQAMQGLSSSGNTPEGGLGSMLEEWQENLSIMAANRTNGDDRVISHLGDCLWKAKGEVASAHICYLVADVNFESFSSNARLCLVGADHWKHPRTYATPEAIQRTEVYEYSKVLGNPQFILVPFQPYKLIYASMLAEAGKAAEALRYCQAVSKTLKTANRAPEVETCRLAAASLEERLRIHMQGGKSVNLAPGKLLRGVISAFDKTIHNIIGGPPQPTGQEQVQMPSSTVEPLTLQDHLGGGRFGGSPSRPPALLGPSASAEKLKETGRAMPQRSVSEPDFSSSMKEKAEQGKPIASGGYLHRFGSVFSKAGGIVSMVSGVNKKEAKLGDKNKFYYDEKLKRWVEEGVEAPQEQAALPPPPISANFVSKVEEASSPDRQFGIGQGSAPPSASKSAYLGTPPVPPSNLFSTRTRQQGVRSRYVDTFNKGANSTTPSKPAVSIFGPAGGFGGAPLPPMNAFVPGSSINSINGSFVNSENGASPGNSEETNVDHNSVSGFNTQDRLDANQQSAVQNVFHQSGMVSSGMPLIPSSENVPGFGSGAMHRVPSSDNTPAFGAPESAQSSGRSLGRSPSNGDIGLSNGYHSRANSWSGYPSNFQTSQAEINSSYDNPATNFSMYNGFSNQGAMNAPATVGSYFPSPPKADIYNPNTSARLSETFASPSPSMSPFMPGIMGVDSRPGELEARSSSQPDISLVGDDLQEVEL